MSFSQPQSHHPSSQISELIPLEYPQSVAVYASYADAQKAVDFLADNDFPVQNLCIVGTDLKSVERVLGRRTWGTVIGGGALSGLGTGLFIALIMVLFMPGMSVLSLFGIALSVGVAMGVLAAAMAHAATRGQRDFNSVTATVATRYEVLGEHNVVERARQMLSQGQQQAPAAPNTSADPTEQYGG